MPNARRAEIPTALSSQQLDAVYMLAQVRYPNAHVVQVDRGRARGSYVVVVEDREIAAVRVERNGAATVTFHAN